MGQRKLCRGNGNVKICIDVLCVDDVMKLWWSKHGNIKFVPYLMVEEMMVDKLNILALTAIFKR